MDDYTAVGRAKALYGLLRRTQHQVRIALRGAVRHVYSQECGDRHAGGGQADNSRDIGDTPLRRRFSGKFLEVVRRIR